MNNAYEFFGLSPNASDEEVKRAYREMAKKYADDFAMMERINAAYDSIVMSGGRTSYSSQSYSSGTGLGDIRAKLNAGRIDDAEMLLDGIPIAQRNAEWYFLKGTIQQRRGWLESAAESFERACQLEPSNKEYKSAYNNIKRSRNGEYRTAQTEKDSDGCCSPCNICSSLMCADCCCECMGGDLIRCC